MKTVIIFSHPWHGSFNKAILDRVEQGLTNRKKEYEIIDLYKDEFNPVLDEENLKGFSTGSSVDDNVQKYQKLLKEADELVFIFPIWWYDVPAILKGFIDKVMLKDFAYTETKSRLLKGLLTHINKTTVITTSGGPTWYLKLFGGNTIKKVFIKSTLKAVGIKNAKWINCSKTLPNNNTEREKFLEKIQNDFTN